MKLIHYSIKPLGTLYSVIGQKPPFHHSDKPSGLWVSVEGKADWKSFSRSMGWLTRLAVENVIELKPEANILRLSTPSEMDAFTLKYWEVCPLALEHPGLFTQPVIDWPRVASEYQGIIVAPYQRSRRMEQFTSWYYCWDCASGCIWDMEAVASVVSRQQNVDTKAQEGCSL